MNKEELVKEISKKTKLSQKVSSEVLSATLEIIQKTVAKKQKVTLEKTVEETKTQILQYKMNNGIYNFNVVIEEKSSGKIVGAILAFASITSPLDLDVNILTESASTEYIGCER